LPEERQKQIIEKLKLERELRRKFIADGKADQFKLQTL
jgi:hypothetical protein